MEQTDDIFAKLNKENALADKEQGVLRISHDAKNRVAIGDFSRGGKNWTKVKTGDHDFAKEHITPYVFNLPAKKQSVLYFVESKVTADCIVDLLIDFVQFNPDLFKGIHTIVLNSDNGPEVNSRRTQFIKRICAFSCQFDLKVKLAYYPPYHSKYNPAERVFGGLEQHWNGDVMDTKETVLKFAKSFVWAGKKLGVKLWSKNYMTGNKLSAKVMHIYEGAIDRYDEYIGKWFVTIDPIKVKDVIQYG